jgi:hypothetical protein
MRKTLTLLSTLAVAGLATTVAGTAAPNKAVTIKASRPIVVYGAAVTLSGKVAMPQSGEKVDVLADPYGSEGVNLIASVDTTAGGRWTFDAKPTIQTTYAARWNGETSPTVGVKVRPAIKLVLGAISGRLGTFTTTATAARAFAGKFVLVQRLTSAGALIVKKVTLDSSSSATFRVRRHTGRSRVRVVMPTSQAAPGYVTGFSNVLTVRR